MLVGRSAACAACTAFLRRMALCRQVADQTYPCAGVCILSSLQTLVQQNAGTAAKSISQAVSRPCIHMYSYSPPHATPLRVSP
eukprot:359660-Chlamydomonas_euryale.AAC.18